MSNNKQQLQAALLSLTMSAEEMTQACTNLVQQKHEDDLYVQWWRSRERTMLKALFSMLCCKRDQTGHPIDLNQLSQATVKLEDFYSLWMQYEWPEAIRQEVDAYLQTLPGLQQFILGAANDAQTIHAFSGMRYSKLFESAPAPASSCEIF